MTGLAFYFFLTIHYLNKVNFFSDVFSESVAGMQRLPLEPTSFDAMAEQMCIILNLFP